MNNRTAKLIRRYVSKVQRPQPYKVIRLVGIDPKTGKRKYEPHVVQRMFPVVRDVKKAWSSIPHRTKAKRRRMMAGTVG